MVRPGGPYLSAVPASRLLRRGDSAHRAGQYVHECNVTYCFVLSRLAKSCIIKNKPFPYTTPMLMIVSSTNNIKNYDMLKMIKKNPTQGKTRQDQTRQQRTGFRPDKVPWFRNILYPNNWGNDLKTDQFNGSSMLLSWDLRAVSI